MDYGIEEDEGILGHVGSALGPLRPYLPYIAVGLLVLAGAYYFLFLAPKPGSVVVTVSELDGGAIDNAQVYFTDSSGKPVGSTQFTAGGTAVFDGIPTQTQLFVTVEAGGGYNTARQAVELAAGSNNVEVQVERKNGIEITATNVPQSFASGCKDRFFVEVTNFGEDTFAAELVSEGTGDFPRYFAVQQGGQRIIGPNESANFSVFAELPDSPGSDGGVQLDGAIRVKGTGKKVAIGGSVGKQLHLEASESEIRYTLDSSNARLITIRNTGELALENFATGLSLEGKLRDACGSDGARCFSIETLGEGGGRNAIAPGSKTDIVLRITPPGEPDTYFGALEITGTCLNSPGISIPIVLDLKGQ